MGILSHGPPEEMAGWIMVFLGLWLPFRNISRCFFHFFHIGSFSPFKAPDTLPKIPILGVMGIHSHGPPEEMAAWIMVFLGLWLPFRNISRCLSH